MICIASLNNNMKIPVECTKPGHICNDCWYSINCLPIEDGFLEDLQVCPGGTTCIDSTGQCGISTHYECDGSYPASISCHGEGVFPDPSNCKKYYMCDEEQVMTYGECRGGSAFNPSTNRCDKKIKDMNRCLSPLPICYNLTQTGAVEGNPNIFYRCKRVYVDDENHFYPEIYSCPDNYHFNGNICVETFPDIEDQGGNCVQAGLFYHPDDCTWYRDCPAKGVSPVTKLCPENNRFDPIKGKCLSFGCENCHI